MLNVSNKNYQYLMKNYKSIVQASTETAKAKFLKTSGSEFGKNTTWKNHPEKIDFTLDSLSLLISMFTWRNSR